jgi:ectoine hydroxylase-related dioxygenase (phytanoyl-CoA dioxygenase family)
MVEADRTVATMNFAAKLEAVPSADWESNGWALVPGFLSMKEIADLRSEAERLCADAALFEERGAVPNSTARSDRLDPVIDVSQIFANLARGDRLVGLVRETLGGEPQLMKDKFIAKPPGAAGYAAHQDAAYWPGLGVDPGRFLTAIIFLDDATAEKGAIECVSGLHGELLTDPDSIADPDEATLGAFTMIEAKAGDLLLLHSLTPHRSGSNRSEAMRRALLFTYGVDPRPNLYALYKQLQEALRRQ